MKVILSRKGFDSEYGEFPSPIFPDGTLCSLPIPSDEWPPFSKLTVARRNLGRVVEDLTHRRSTRRDGVHLDPDLRREMLARERGWRPSFGTVGAAQTHLEKQGVGQGDLFLFFGWFRRTIELQGQLVYDPDAPNLHVIFGWLQVGKIFKPSRERGDPPMWSRQHPHVKGARFRSSNNTLYVAAKWLKLPGGSLHVPAGGAFERFVRALCLTKEGERRTAWRLPARFHPSGDRPPLSYHGDRRRWRKDVKGVVLETVARGQEFVLDCDYYPECFQWLRGLLSSGT